MKKKNKKNTRKAQAQSKNVLAACVMDSVGGVLASGHNYCSDLLPCACAEKKQKK